MEKKLTNSGPFIQSTSKHSIYPCPPVEAGISLGLDLETGRLKMTIRDPDVLERMKNDAAAEGLTLDEYMQHIVHELAQQHMPRGR